PSDFVQNVNISKNSEHKKQLKELPKTGENTNNINSSLIASLTALFGFFLIGIRRKKKSH
ncbi:LPXTG cell wall anchor domain-containing protein, partial [Staphylococcus haemolyticus]|uniref:LPXTG cell wall anchor domain-containing protein n=1 Tax=Staphylococcus haemolyticus TaxID=1283 RepID=UPI0034D4A40A